jgi:hypothetical protein
LPYVIDASLSYNHALDLITARRASAIALIIRQKEDILARYTTAWGQTPLCKARLPSEECDALILGSVVKSLQSAKPTMERRGMSILKLKEEIGDFRLSFLPIYSSNSIHRKVRGGPSRQGSHSQTCSPIPASLALIERTISSVSGIDLEASGRIPVRGSKWEVVEVR